MPATAIAAVLLASLFDETGTFLPAGALESFRSELGPTYGEAGWVLTAITPGAVVGLIFSVAADHFSRRIIAAGGAWLYAASLGVFTVADSFGWLLVAAFLMGAAATALVDSAEVALVDLAGSELRPFLARSNLAGVVGDFAGPLLLAAAVGMGLGWRAAFAVAAAVMVLYGLLLAVAPLPPPRNRSAGESSSTSSRVVASIALDRRVWVIALVSALLGPFDEPFLGFLSALAQQERSVSTAAATLLTLAAIVGGVLVYTVGEKRLRAAPDRRLAIWGGALLVGGSVMLAVLPSMAAMFLGAFLVGTGINVTWLGIQHRTLTLHPGYEGTTKAVVSTIELSGFALPALIGAGADRLGLPFAMGIYVMLAVAVVALGSRMSHRTHQTDTDSERHSRRGPPVA